MSDKTRALEREIAEIDRILTQGALFLTRDAEERDDLIQATYALVIRHIDKFNEARNKRAWLLVVERRVFYTWLRQEGRRMVEVACDPTILDETEIDDEPDAELLRAELVRNVRLHLAQLPPDLRRFARAAVELGLDDTVGLAERLNVSRANIYNKRWRLIEWVKIRMTPGGSSRRGMPVRKLPAPPADADTLA